MHAVSPAVHRTGPSGKPSMLSYPSRRSRRLAVHKRGQTAAWAAPGAAPGAPLGACFCSSLTHSWMPVEANWAASKSRPCRAGTGVAACHIDPRGCWLVAPLGRRSVGTCCTGAVRGRGLAGSTPCAAGEAANLLHTGWASMLRCARRPPSPARLPGGLAGYSASMGRMSFTPMSSRMARGRRPRGPSPCRSRHSRLAGRSPPTAKIPALFATEERRGVHLRVAR